jgi:monoamine oxidase
MAKKSFTRRQFLSYSALGASAYSLAGCAGLNQFFTDSSYYLRDEVVILGAGAAGLAAAFELKKRKIPYRIFEASSRVGGRVQSVQILPDSPLMAEMGAEFFQDYHQSVLALADELSLSPKEIQTETGLEPQLFLLQSRVLKTRDLIPLMGPAKNVFRRVRADLFRNQDVLLTASNALQYERASYYDSLNLQDLLKSWQREVDPRILRLIEIQAVNRFGIPAEQQSALMFLSTLNGEGSSLLQSSKTYRLEGGLTQLINALAQRVAGVIPGRILKMQHELVEVEERGGLFRFIFKTPQGKEVYKTQRVICTLPLSRLKLVRGFEDLSWNAPVAEFVKDCDYARHEKGSLLWGAAFWRQGSNAHLGNWTGDFPSQKIWHSGRSQKNTQALLTFQRASRPNEITLSQEQISKDLGLFYSKVPAPVAESFQSVDWKQRSWALGSMLYYKPGQFTKYNGLLGQGFYQGAFQFAGEHVSEQFPGSLEGAIETGIRAAGAFLPPPTT